MGFSTVILVGVDHSFATKGTPNTTVQSEGDDPNHFSAAYFGKGFRWQLPDLETSELAYRMAREAYKSDGRQVLDATIGGKLQVFPKVAYGSLCWVISRALLCYRASGSIDRSDFGYFLLGLVVVLYPLKTHMN
jgi:hypothetical protein